jgi:high-affinity nickel permease
MFGILGIGFLLGMQHALEADHLAAVSSIAARRTDVRDIVKHGLTCGHGDGTKHIHVHSHVNETIPHQKSSHLHQHGLRWRTLLVGLMHGMAGSAALLVLAVSQVANPAYRMLYVLLIGIGSMLGMGALSVVIAVPLAVSARWLTWANRGLQGGVGAITIGISAMTIYSTVHLQG